MNTKKEILNRYRKTPKGVITLRKSKQIIEEEMEEDAGVKLRMLDVEI